MDAPRRWMDEHRWARPLAASLALFLAFTFVLSLVRVARRATSPRARRARTVDLNKARLRTACSGMVPGVHPAATCPACHSVERRM